MSHFSKALSFYCVLLPHASETINRLFVRHPEILITDFCFCLVLGWLWWLNWQGLCGGKTRTKNGLWPRQEPPPHPRTLSPRSFEGWPIVRGWFRSLACIEFPQVWTSVLFSWKETRKLTPFLTKLEDVNVVSKYRTVHLILSYFGINRGFFNNRHSHVKHHVDMDRTRNM